MIIPFIILIIIVVFAAKIFRMHFLPVFILINLTVIVNMVLGGELTKLFLGDSFVQPGVDIFVLSSIFIPTFVFLFVYLFFGKYFFSNGVLKKNDIETFNTWSIKLLSYSKVIFLISISFNLFIMLKEQIFFRDFYKYIIKNNLGFQLTIAYTSGLFTLLYFLLKKKYLFSFITLFLLLILGKKHPILFAFVIPYLYVIFINPKIKFKYLLLPPLILFMFGGLGIFFSGINISVLEQLSSSFDYYYNFNYFISVYDLGIDQGEIFFSSFYKYIPRIIWTSKPEVYGFLLIHEKIYYSEMLTNFYPSAFEEFSELLADFGWYLGFFLIAIKKFFWYIVFFYKNITLKFKFFVILYFLDPFLMIYALIFQTLFYSKISNKTKHV